jgi:hypothetical protein
MVARYLILIICWVVGIMGCAANGPIFQNAPDPQESYALVYIYRPGTFTFSARDAYFYINDINIVDLTNEGYTWFHIPSGEYTLKQKWPIDLSFEVVELKVEWLPKHKYFYRLSTGMISMTLLWQLSEVSVELAETEIRACKLQPAFGAQKVLDQRNKEK